MDHVQRTANIEADDEGLRCAEAPPSVEELTECPTRIVLDDRENLEQPADRLRSPVDDARNCRVVHRAQHLGLTLEQLGSVPSRQHAGIEIDQRLSRRHPNDHLRSVPVIDGVEDARGRRRSGPERRKAISAGQMGSDQLVVICHE
jgi:hypothetical protein